MLLMGVLLLILALTAMAFGLGFISMPNSAIRRRVRTMKAVPVETKRKSVSIDRSRDSWMSKLTSAKMLGRIERNMVLAGRPEGWSRERVVIAKPLGAVFGFLFATVIISKTDSLFLTLFAVGIVILGYFVPDLLIYNQAIKRQAEIQKELPDMLDQVVIGIEAGVGFESALARAGERNEGPLADEIVRLLQDLSLGLSRREAYMDLADRTSVDELKNFAKAIVQAEEYGVSVSKVVRTQAKEMRIGRRARAEAKAQQVPVKILLPLMLCILPVLFIIVLGPPVTNAFRINS